METSETITSQDITPLDSEFIEIWKPVVGFEGIYEVSNLGPIRRIQYAPGTYNGKILKPGIDKDGYLKVVLSNQPKKKRTVHVHIVVAEAFLGPRPEGKQVNHIDTNKKNCRSLNLEYLTRLEHEQHAIKNGQKYQGEKHWTKTDKVKMVLTSLKVAATIKSNYKTKGPTSYKYTDDEIAEVLVLLSWNQMSLSQIARTVGMSVAHIYRIKNQQSRSVAVAK